MEAKFTGVALSRCSFSLPKSLVLPDCVESVAIDIGIRFNMAAAGKFELLRIWPKTVDV